MLDSTILLLALASPVPANAAPERGSIPLVAMLRDEHRLASLATLDDTPVGRMPDRAEGVPSRWDGAGGQFLAGTAGGAIGAVGGGFMGGAIAGAMVRDDGGWGALGALLFGIGIGAGVGGTAMTATFVKMASSDAYPSRSIWPAWGGSVLGVVAGGVLVAQVASSSNGTDWGIWPAIGTIVVCSSTGAVLLDRAVASPTSFSVVPWSPRPGMQGAHVRLAF